MRLRALAIALCLSFAVSCTTDYCTEAYKIMQDCRFGMMAGEAERWRGACDAGEPVGSYISKCLVKAGHGCSPFRYMACIKLTHEEVKKGNLRVEAQGRAE